MILLTALFIILCPSAGDQHPHFTNQDTDAQRGEVISPKVHSTLATESRLGQKCHSDFTTSYWPHLTVFSLPLESAMHGK